METRRPCLVDERGLPLVPEGFSECYDICLRGIKETNRHHLLWPRSDYKSAPERHARQSDCMIVESCVCKHSSYHATYLPPKKPGIHTLYDITQGDLQPSEAVVYIRERYED